MNKNIEFKTGKWIWHKDMSYYSAENQYMMFRHSFDLSIKPVEAMIRATADSRYILYVNGHKIMRGPCKGDLQHYSVEELEVMKFLSMGKNVIAAIVHVNTGLTCEMHSGHGGFICELEAIDADGKRNILGSDENWKCIAETGYEQHHERTKGFLNYHHIFDARKEPENWNLPECNESMWSDAVCLSEGETKCWNLIPRSLPHLEEKISYPNDISEYEKSGKRAINLPLLIDLQDKKKLIIDFGREITGFIKIDCTGINAVINIRYAEEPNCFLPMADKLTTASETDWEAFHYIGFRYLYLDIHVGDVPLKINSISCNEFSFPVVRAGSFKCSDFLLNRIWEIGRDTVYCCMHETYEDCPGYEQLQYWGDAKIQALVSMVCWGEHRLFSHGLRQMTWSSREDGLMQSRYPSAGAQYIPTFNLTWIMTLWDHWIHLGDKKFIQELYPQVDRVINWFKQYLNQDMLLEDVPEWVFVDWIPVLDGLTYKKGIFASVNAMFVGALQTAAKLATVVGCQSDALLYSSLRKVVGKAFEKTFWDDERQVYFDLLLDGKPLELDFSGKYQHSSGFYEHSESDGFHGVVYSQSTHALALLYDLVPESRYERVINVMLGSKALQCSCMFMIYIFRALKRAGRYDLAFDQIRRWENMIVQGATTFWEVWENSRSLCHGWSASPTYEMSTEILGVRPIEPGYKVVELLPETGDLEWAEGKIPTPYGNISVKWRQDYGTVFYEYTVPNEIEVVCRKSKAIKYINLKQKLEQVI